MKNQLRNLISAYLTEENPKAQPEIIEGLYDAIKRGVNDNDFHEVLSSSVSFAASMYRRALMSPPCSSITRQKTNELVKVLVASGAKPDANISGIAPSWQHEHYTTLLQTIVERDPDNLEMVHFLLGNGASSTQFSSKKGNMLLDNACSPAYEEILRTYGARHYKGLKILMLSHDDSEYKQRLQAAYEKLGAEVVFLPFQRMPNLNSETVSSFLKGIDLLAIPGEAAELPEHEKELREFYSRFIMKCLSKNIPIDGECAGHQRFFQTMTGKVDNFRTVVSGHSGAFPRIGSDRRPRIHEVTIQADSGLADLVKSTSLLTDSDHKQRINLQETDCTAHAIGVEARMGQVVEAICTRDSVSTPYPLGRSTQFHPSAAMNISANAALKTNRLDAASYRKSHKERYQAALHDISEGCVGR